MFTFWDWLVLALAALALAAIGLAAARPDGDADFLRPGPGLAWPALALSLAATQAGAGILPRAAALGYAGDLRPWIWELAALPALIAAARCFPVWRAQGFPTSQAALAARLGRVPGRAAAGLAAALVLARLALAACLPAWGITYLTGLPAWAAAAAMGGLAFLLAGRGGLRAAVRGDLFYLLLLALALAGIGIRLGNSLRPWRETLDLAAAAGKSRWSGGGPGPGYLAGYGAWLAAFHLCDPHCAQRYLAARGRRAAALAAISGWGLALALGLAGLAAGAGLYAFFQIRVVELPPSLDARAVLAYFALNLLPPGWRGACAAALLAAGACALASGGLALAALRAPAVPVAGPVPPPRARIGWLAGGIAFGAVAAAGGSVDGGRALGWAAGIAGLAAGPLLGLFLLARWRPAAPSPVLGTALAAGLIAGMAAVTWPLQIVFPPLFGPLTGLSAALGAFPALLVAAWAGVRARKTRGTRAGNGG